MRGLFVLAFHPKIHYNLIMDANLMRLMLAIYFLSMTLLAAFFLRRRNLPWLEYAVWGLVSILFPAVGPFLVIWMRPGQK